MKLTNRSLTEGDKRAICAWHYDGAYSIYNLPPWEEMKRTKSGFFHPEKEKNFHAFLDGDILVGFVNISEEASAVFLGIGINSEFCGKHYGRQILEEAYRISKSLYPEKPLCLEVRTWNVRAVTCYEKAGFRIDGEPFSRTTLIGEGTFYRIVRK